MDFSSCSEDLNSSSPGLDVGIVGEKLAGGLDGDVDSAGAHFVDGLALGLCDLLLGDRGAARDIVLGLLVRFAEQHLRLALGRGHDVGGFLLGFLALLLVLGEQRLRFLAQPARLVEVGADLGGAGIERLGDHARHLQIDDDAEEDDESDECPECCQ